MALAGLLFAPHYAAARDCHCVMDGTMLRAAPTSDAPAVSQLAYGEGFAVLDLTGGWAWGKCLHDDYVGYLPDAALGVVEPPTHRVTAPRAPLFAAPDIKAPVVGALSIGALAAGAEAGDFLVTAGGHLHRRHVAPAAARAADPVEVAERLIGAPYLWGGRGAGGIDCSGLVQRVLGLAGIASPRDSDQQRDALGRALGGDEPPRRGDLVFFPGHVGLMVDADRLIHATAFWMAVAVEPLAAVVARLAPLHADPVSARRRIDG